MDPTAPKDNANPTIHLVNKGRSRARQAPLAWDGFGEFQKTKALGESPISNEWIPMAPEDRAALHALVDASIATNGKGVSILRNVGLEIPDSTNQALKYPQFQVAQSSRTRLAEAKSFDHNEAETIASSSCERDAIDAEEVFDIIRNIQDPEHPNTLEELKVVCLEHVEVNDHGARLPDSESFTHSTVRVRFTPTIPHCSMATLIGLSLRVKLLRSLPTRFKVTVEIQPGTHASEKTINKQLKDKERVCAALENKHLTGVVNKCIKAGMEDSH